MDYRIYDIYWDTEGETAGLPREVIIEGNIFGFQDIEDVWEEIQEYITDEYGFCTFDYKVGYVG